MGGHCEAFHRDTDKNHCCEMVPIGQLNALRAELRWARRMAVDLERLKDFMVKVVAENKMHRAPERVGDDEQAS